MDNAAWVADATERIYIRNLEDRSGLIMPACSQRAGHSLRSYTGTDCVGTTARIGWNESPVCYHSFSEAKAGYLRSRGIPALACINDAWYGN